MKLLFLPTYSPDLNPIELAFGSTKALIRREGAEMRRAMESRDPAVGEALISWCVYTTFTAENARAWFRYCGYY
jgi:transposase